MPSPVDIANSALVKVGSEPIMDLNEDKKSARLCKNRIYQCLKIVLRMHPWNCVTERVELAPLATTPEHTFDYEHQLPSDCLRVISINPINEDDYRIENGKISTDTQTVELTYIKDPGEELGRLDVLCAEAVACYLAWDICFPLTESRALKNDIWNDFDKILKRAKSIDAKEDPYLEVEAELFIESREASSSGPMRANR